MKKLTLGWLVIAGLANACSKDETPAVDAATMDAMMGDAGMSDADMGTDAAADADVATDAATDAMTAVDNTAACRTEAIVNASAMLDATITVMGDTTMAPLGITHEGCLTQQGSPIPLDAAPQQVVALTVPGTGLVRLEFSLINDVTSPMYDTLVEVRNGATCTDFAEAQCFDDTTARERRSSGAFFAQGGSVVYVAVTSFFVGDPDMPTLQPTAGPWQMTVRATTPSAPMITQEGATAALVDDDRLEIHFAGMDADRDVAFLTARFFDAANTVITTPDPDGGPDVTNWELGADFTYDMATFAGSLETGGVTMFPTLAAMAAVEVFVTDEAEFMSNVIRMPVTRIMVHALGETCGTETLRCAAPLACVEGICAIPEDRAAVCAAAIPVAFVANAATATAVIEPGMGALEILQCEPSATPSREAVLAVTIPAEGSFDLLATTIDEATPVNTDTVLYSMETCGNYSEMDMCFDDTSGMDARSSLTILNVTAGRTYHVAAELFRAPMMSTMFPVHFSLRPILSVGAECDLMGIANRCADGASCRAGVMMAPATCVMNGVGM